MTRLGKHHLSLMSVRLFRRQPSEVLLWCYSLSSSILEAYVDIIQVYWLISEDRERLDILQSNNKFFTQMSLEQIL